MTEVLEFEAGADAESPERREDIHEILNYRRAMDEAERMLKTLPVSRRVICRDHEVLLDSVRGAGKSPGEYRRVPNWIGPPGCGVEEARFVPPAAPEIPDAMSRWERYANASAGDVPDRLVQLAVLHAEFEALHPFLDGNDRVGRMLIPLLLWQWGMVERPHFYVSGFLEAHRSDYYESLLSVSRDRDWTTWTLFFMRAIVPDSEPDGVASVNNGLALCRLHHAAFDKFFVGVRPNYIIEVRRDVMAERDGPTLRHAIQGLDGQRIVLPKRRVDHPDIEALSKRYERFREQAKAS